MKQVKEGSLYRDGSSFIEVISVKGNTVEYRHFGSKKKLLEKNFQKRFIPVNMDQHAKEEIIVDSLKHCEVNSDAGGHGLSFECPVCNTEVIYAPNAWWKMECPCRTWGVEIKAIGYKKEIVE